MAANDRITGPFPTTASLPEPLPEPQEPKTGDTVRTTNNKPWGWGELSEPVTMSGRVVDSFSCDAGQTPVRWEKYNIGGYSDSFVPLTVQNGVFQIGGISYKADQCVDPLFLNVVTE